MKRILALAGMFGAIGTASAIFPFYEPFADATSSGGTSYAEGSLLDGQINATGDRWYATGSTQTGAPVVITNANLSYAGLPASSGNALWLQNASGPGGRMFVSTTTDGFLSMDVSNTVFYSMIIQVLDVTNLSETGDHSIGFNNQATIADQTAQPSIQGARLYFKKVSATEYQIGVSKQSTNMDWDPTIRTVGEVLFVVIVSEIIPPSGSVNDNVRLWVNPASATFGTHMPPEDNARLLGVEPDQATRLSSFQILNRTTSNPNSMIVDEVRVGFTWAFVTGGPEIYIAMPAETNISPNLPFLGVAAKSGSAAPVTYQWQRNGVNLVEGAKFSGVTTATLTIANADQADEGTYAIVVSNDMGSATNSSYVTIGVPDPEILAQPESRTNAIGTTATFTVNASGTAPLSYQWYRGMEPLADGENISGATSATLTISPVSNADGGNYYVIVTSGTANSLNSAVATLTVTIEPGTPLYWDTNGEFPGGEGIGGNWGTDPYWSVDPDGAVRTGMWLAGGHAVFSAGNDALSAINVAVGQSQVLAGLTGEEGQVTMSGSGVLVFANPSGTSVLHVAESASVGIGNQNVSVTVAGTNDLVKTGPGSLEFRSANNTYVGRTILQEGIFRLQQDNRLSAIPETFTPDSVVLDGGTMDWFNTGSQDIHANRGFTITANGGTLMRSAGNVGIDVNIMGAVTGPGALTRNGQALITLSGVNDFAGPLTNNGGNTALSGVNTLPNGIFVNGGELRINSNFAAGTGVITLEPNAGLRTSLAVAGEVVTVTNSVVTTGPWALIAAGSGSQAHLELAGVISGSGGLLRPNIGDKRVILSGANTYSGGTKITHSILVAGHKSAFGTGPIIIGEQGPDEFPVGGAFNFIQFNGATMDMTGENAIPNPIIAYQQFSMAITISTNALEFSGPMELAADFDIRVFANFAPLTHRLSGVISSPMGRGLEKHGVGTLVLSAANTYPGGTKVVNGTLRVNNASGSGTGSGMVNVESAGTLGGSGTIAGSVHTWAGALSPGASSEAAGKLTIEGGLDLSTGTGTVLWKLAALKDDASGVAGVDFDQIALTGGTLNAGLNCAITPSFLSGTAPHPADPFWQQPRQWTVLRLSGAASNPSGTGFDIVNNATNSAGFFTTSVAGDGSVVLHFTPDAVAQPSFAEIVAAPGGATFSWESHAGLSYSVEYKTNLNQPGWLTLTNLSGTGGLLSVTDENGTDPQRFYRLLIVP